MADGGVYRAWERFLNGLSNKPKSHKFLSLVFPQKGWRFCNTRDVGQGKNKKRGARLYLSKIGFFALILHRELPENQVCQMCVKVYASGRSYIIFLVEEAGVEEQSSKEPVKAVGVELGIARLATLSDGRVLQNPKPLEALLKESGCFRASRKRFLSKNWLKTKTCKGARTLKGFQA
ncbi:hypothetical protein B9Q02_08550 [Candidatus Marsarchaeota G1 archaeon BE_D]|uniref:Uncharacterized protein n=1 Tax=Candidatus Marsarchaeota G1 archaeon BE_D TaxID=1978156 RepID=A0A2R6AEN8_9ARCH|nr:MAG: hypothetical protein B9Q02_08550 [Candidatus Marsarchaeota G1 archaeon BE_D]